MFRSGRGKRLAAFLASTLGLAFVAFALIYGLSQQFHYQQVAHNNATEYARHTTYQEKQACRGIAAVQLPQCRADAKSEYSQKRADNRREYDDLVAQQTSALWTGIMGIAALTGMVLSVIGVLLVYTTFKETKAANVIARQAAYDAAADAKKSRDALIASDRAIMFITQAFQDIPVEPGGLRTTVYLRFENRGKSTAYGFQIKLNVGMEPVWKATTRFTHNVDQICAAGGTILCSFNIRTPKKFPAYLIGFVTYSTMGDVHFRSYFCFRIDGVAEQVSSGQTINTYLEHAECQRLPAMK